MVSVRRRSSTPVVSGNQDVLLRSEAGRRYLKMFSPGAKGDTGRRFFAERKATLDDAVSRGEASLVPFAERMATVA